MRSEEKFCPGCDLTGKREEIASLMRYLATDGAAFITGTSIVADGGATIGG